ncbi:1503_t:CDS:2, partial [Entrophospora sp. SA101]
KKSITISKTAYEASEDADAIVITTEWDEFKVFISINITCLILELYPSVLWAEVVHHLSDEMLSSLGILYLIIYSTPSGFQYNFKLTRKEGDDISYAKKSMDIKILDIIGILLMVLPIAIQLPLAAFAGHEADINNIQFADGYINCIYKNDSTKNIPSIRRLKTTRKV